jgi:predicted DNA-binding ArsR family transcriptional regulator
MDKETAKKHRATEDNLLAAFKDIHHPPDDEEAGPLAKLLKSAEGGSVSAVNRALAKANVVLDGHGIEGLPSRGMEGLLSYVNMGDPYTPTVMYDHDLGQFLIMGWADWLEDKERQDGQEEETQVTSAFITEARALAGLDMRSLLEDEVVEDSRSPYEQAEDLNKILTTIAKSTDLVSSETAKVAKMVSGPEAAGSGTPVAADMKAMKIALSEMADMAKELRSEVFRVVGKLDLPGMQSVDGKKVLIPGKEKHNKGKKLPPPAQEAAAPKKLKGKALDKEIEKIYYKVGDRVQINIMDIGKIFAAGRAAYEAGTDMEAAIKAAVEKYRKN